MGDGERAVRYHLRMLDFAAEWGARQGLGLGVQLALFAGILRLIAKLSDQPEPGGRA